MVLDFGNPKLYRTKPTPPFEPLPVSKEEEEIRALRVYGEDTTAAVWAAYTPECKTPFVLILSIDDTAPPENDYSAVARALKGHDEFAGARFIEYANYGHRGFGARVADAATGRALVAALSGKRGLVCFVPAAIKRIDFDFETGAIARTGPP